MAYIFESTLLVSISKLLDHSAHITPVLLTFKLALPLHPSVDVTASPPRIDSAISSSELPKLSILPHSLQESGAECMSLSTLSANFRLNLWFY